MLMPCQAADVAPAGWIPAPKDAFGTKSWDDKTDAPRNANTDQPPFHFIGSTGKEVNMDMNGQ
jgi:hypothetical protein